MNELDNQGLEKAFGEGLFLAFIGSCFTKDRWHVPRPTSSFQHTVLMRALCRRSRRIHFHLQLELAHTPISRTRRSPLPAPPSLLFSCGWRANSKQEVQCNKDITTWPCQRSAISQPMPELERWILGIIGNIRSTCLDSFR